MKTIGVVTVDYNTASDTHTLLESLRKIKQTDFILSIIVVDNGSKEPFKPTAEENKQNLTLLYLPQNTGFTGGFNVGMQKALEMKTDYVLILNNDTIVDPDMIKNLLKTLDSSPKIGLVVPKIYFAKGHETHEYKKEDLGHVLWYAGGHMDWANVYSIHRGMDEVDKGQYDKTEKVDFASGCCMMFKREVLERVGLFDDRLFLYYEDADLNERVKRAGYDEYYVPSAILVHVNASSSGGPGNTMQDYFHSRNQMLFGLHYAPLRTKIALIRQSIRFLINGRPMQRKGIIDFYLGKFGRGTYFDKKS